MTYFLKTPNWPATAAAVLLVGRLVQSPKPNTLGYLNSWTAKYAISEADEADMIVKYPKIFF